MVNEHSVLVEERDVWFRYINSDPIDNDVFFEMQKERSDVNTLTCLSVLVAKQDMVIQRLENIIESDVTLVAKANKVNRIVDFLEKRKAY